MQLKPVVNAVVLLPAMQKEKTVSIENTIDVAVIPIVTVIQSAAVDHNHSTPDIFISKISGAILFCFKIAKNHN